MHTVNRDVEIAGLFLATDWISFDELAQQNTASAVIEFDYTPEQREIMRPDPSDCQPYEPAQVRIQAIKLTADVQFEGNGTSACLRAGLDLYERLNPGYVSDLEDDIRATIQRGERYYREAA